MRFLNAVFLIAAVALLTGCAFFPRETYFSGEKEGANQKDFAKDFLACQVLSRREFGYVDDNIVMTCMTMGGWQMEKKKKFF